MRIQTLEELRAGEYHGTKRIRLTSCGLSEFPREILDLADSLEVLDLSGNPISQLPEDIGRLHSLRIAFFSDCKFTVFPKELSKCPSLEMVAFRGNGMTTIPEGSFPPQLRWLILTNNRIEALPRSIGACPRLQKVMLAGNCLTSLPCAMASCKKLGLLRLSANHITNLPDWLFELPELAFLSFAGNPCTPSTEDNPALADIDWSDLVINEVLGEGASGIISKGVWNAAGGTQAKEVAIKLFKGDVTSDGSPADEMNACMAAGSHPSLIDALGKIRGYPDKRGLVLQLIPPTYQNLGLPPSLQSCTRDTYPPGTKISFKKCVAILGSIAGAAAHLHKRHIAHGDLYAHNILVDESGHGLLGDFGAATIYCNTRVDHLALQRLEVLAFGHLIEVMLGLLEPESLLEEEGPIKLLKEIHLCCKNPVVAERPLFLNIQGVIERCVTRWDECKGK
jgi:hypothetical protein